MKRKVIQIAESTQLISLPRKWTLKYGIKKGDELEVEEKGARIVVTPDKKVLTKELTADVSGLTPDLAGKFVSRAYQKGYDRLKLKFDNPEIMIAIQSKIPELMGYEIMDKNREQCEIQVLSGRLDIDIETSLKRAFLTVIDMADSNKEFYKKTDLSGLKNVEQKDLEVNKFCYFCLRAISKGFQNDPNLHFAVRTLEDLGDRTKQLANALIGLGKAKKEYRIRETEDSPSRTFRRSSKTMAGQAG